MIWMLEIVKVAVPMLAGLVLAFVAFYAGGAGIWGDDPAAALSEFVGRDAVLTQDTPPSAAGEG